MSSKKGAKTADDCSDTIYLVPHTHYDAIWVFTKEEYFYINIDLVFKKVVSLLDSTKEYSFIIEQVYLLQRSIRSLRARTHPVQHPSVHRCHGGTVQQRDRRDGGLRRGGSVKRGHQLEGAPGCMKLPVQAGRHSKWGFYPYYEKPTSPILRFFDVGGYGPME